MSKLPTRQDNYSERYNQLVEKAGLAESSDVRGCMVIKPRGYAIRDQIRLILDTMLKNTGHQNAYFPLLIPKSYLSQEAAHVEGFAKECAVVTHHRLKSANGGVQVDPEAKLEEELIIRPTSETIIWKTYKKWINSYRDLPVLINQWANVMRREMRTRLFLRTSEFLWQEGHTAHATRKAAWRETKKMLQVYQDCMETFLAISGVPGVKSSSERFAGAEETLTIEAMMQDFKALQSCTSHFLGQNFAKAFDVTYVDKHNESQFVWSTSRGMSTRIMGALVMSHSDDAGLILPPAIAPVHVVIVPIFRSAEQLDAIEAYLAPALDRLRKQTLTTVGQFAQLERPVTVKFDTDDQNSPGWKFSEREMKGVPVRITVGPRDMEQGLVELARRDSGEKQSIKLDELVTTVLSTLAQMQTDLLERNRAFRLAHTKQVESWEEFVEQIEQGFALAYRDGTEETEMKIKQQTKATIRCLPFDQPTESGSCVFTGSSTDQLALFAKAY